MSTPTTAAFLVGQIVLFKGYTPDEAGNLPDPQLLNVGEKVRIDREQNDGSFVIYSLDRKDAEGKEIGDAAFPEEIEHTGDAADLEVGKKKAPAKNKAKETKAAPAAEVKTETAAAAPAKAAAKPKAAAKSKTKAAAKTGDFKEASPEELKGQKNRPSSEKAEGEQGLPGGVTLGEKAQDNKPVVVITDTAAVKKILSESSDVIEAAVALAKKSQQNEFALGGVLHHIRETGIWKSAKDALGNAYEGKRGFTQFIKDKLDIDYRKALYLDTIYTTFRRLGQDEKSLEAMGWSKAKELAALANMKDEDENEIGFDLLSENFDELSSFAAKNSREDLVAKIQKLSEHLSDEKIKVTKFNFKLTGQAAELAERAMVAAEAKIEGEGNKRNDAFEYILGDWMLHNADMTLDDALAGLEQRFGVTLGIVTPEGEEDAAEDQDQTVEA